MVNFKHPSGLRFLQNKKTPFINLKKIIKLAKSLKLVSEDRIIIDELINSLNNNKFPFILTPQEYFHLERMDEKKWIKYLIYRYKLNIYPEKKLFLNFLYIFLLNLLQYAI